MCVSLSNFELIPFIYGHPILPTFEEIVFSLFNGLDIFVKSHLAIIIKIYFSHPVHWTVPFSLLIPYCFDYSSFVISLKLNSGTSSFFFQSILVTESLHKFYMIFFWFKGFFFRKGVRIFVIITLNLWTNFGNIDILKYSTSQSMNIGCISI